MPYAWFLASCNMGSHMFLLLFLDLAFPPLSLLLPVSQDYSRIATHFWGSVDPLLSRVFSIESWDSLSGYVHPGIACLAFQASHWLGAFRASLSDYPNKGVYPRMTYC